MSNTLVPCESLLKSLSFLYFLRYPEIIEDSPGEVFGPLVKIK